MNGAEDLVIGARRAVVCRPGPDDDVEAALARAREEGAEAFVLVSSARLYGADPGHDMMLGDDAPLAEFPEGSEGASLARADRLCCEAAGSGSAPRVVVLRPVHELGPGASGPLARYLAAPRVRARFGFDPLMSVIHTTDVDRAVELAVTGEVTGPWNVAGDGGLPLSVLVGLAGGSRITGPTGVLVDLARDLGADVAARMDERDLRYVLSVDDRGFRRATGYEPAVSLAETVAELGASHSDGGATAGSTAGGGPADGRTADGRERG